MISAREFTERVADRIERPFEEVLPFLREYGLLPAGAPPRPRKLLVTEIAFSGVKTIDGGAIPFDSAGASSAQGYGASPVRLICAARALS